MKFNMEGPRENNDRNEHDIARDELLRPIDPNERVYESELARMQDLISEVQDKIAGASSEEEKAKAKEELMAIQATMNELDQHVVEGRGKKQINDGAYEITDEDIEDLKNVA